MTATAGAFLTEERLRAYLKCSQFFNFGGTEPPLINTRMAQYTLEYWYASSIRNPSQERNLRITKATLAAAKHLELDLKYLVGQSNELISKTTLWLDDFLKLFPSDKYFPVYGPMPFIAKVSKTPIRLNISAVLRTEKNSSLHLISFTPYRQPHDRKNDPIQHLKLNALKGFVRHSPLRPQAILHTLWATDAGTVGYSNATSNQLNETYLQVIERKMQEMEGGSFFPVLPCRYTCPYKTKCKPPEN